MTAPEPAKPLPRRKSYGPFVRIVQPDRHIYQTTMDYRRWMLAVAAGGCATLAGWIARDCWRNRTELLSQIFGVFITVGTLALLGVLYMIFVYRTRLEITPRGIVLEKRGFSGRSSRRIWSIDALESVGVADNPTFHIGGSTPTYPIYLSFANGEQQSLFVTFDDLRPAERMAKDIAESIEFLAEKTPAH